MRVYVQRNLASGNLSSGNWYNSTAEIDHYYLEAKMNDLKLLQDVIAFLFHIMHDENTTDEQKQVAKELSERVAVKIAELRTCCCELFEICRSDKCQ